MLLSQIIYSFFEVIPENRKFFMLLSRFVLGLGASKIFQFIYNLFKKLGGDFCTLSIFEMSHLLLFLDMALLRTFISNKSSTNERAKAMAILTCGTAIGNSIGPGKKHTYTKNHLLI